MSVEYNMGYCPSCDSDKKLERQQANHILHFFITVLLGAFTYGIGSIIWLCVWFFVSVKVGTWKCHTCGNEKVEPSHNHSENNNTKSKSNISDIIKKSYKIIIGLVLIIIAVVFLYPLFQDDNNIKNKSEKKQSKEKVVNATVDIKDKEKKKNTLNLKSVESDLCYIYDTIREPNLLRGTVSCKEGKLTIRFYNSDTNREVITKTVNFQDHKFSIKIEGIENNDFTSEIKLSQKQIKERLNSIKKEKPKSISSIKFEDEKENECILEKWRYVKFSDEYLLIEGRTTCALGQIIFDIYEKKNIHLGKESAFINNGVFKVYHKNSSNPTDLSIDYTILDN